METLSHNTFLFHYFTAPIFSLRVENNTSRSLSLLSVPTVLITLFGQQGGLEQQKNRFLVILGKTFGKNIGLRPSSSNAASAIFYY